MRLHWTMSAREELWSPLPPELVAERLAEAVEGGGRITGSVSERTFSVQCPVPRRRNSWRPFLSGELVAHEGGTLLRVSLRPHLFVVGFTFLHAIPFLGLTWLMGVAAFSWEVPTALAAVGEVVDAVPAAEARALMLAAGGPSQDAQDPESS